MEAYVCLDKKFKKTVLVIVTEGKEEYKVTRWLDSRYEDIILYHKEIWDDTGHNHFVILD